MCNSVLDYLLIIIIKGLIYCSLLLKPLVFIISGFVLDLLGKAKKKFLKQDDVDEFVPFSSSRVSPTHYVERKPQEIGNFEIYPDFINSMFFMFCYI